MLNRVIKLLLTTLLLTGCVTNDKINKMNIDAKYITNLLLEKNYDEVLNHCDKQMKSLLTVDALKTIFDKYDDHYEITSVNTKEIDGYNVDTVNIKLQDLMLILTITISDNELIGLYYTEEHDLIKTNDYNETQLNIESANFPIKGRMIIPNNPKQYSLVIIVGGSGPTDMDGNIGVNKVYKNLAIKLAENNIASIRYDKRTKNYQPLTYDDLLDYEYIDDLNILIDYANTLDNIKDIIILGHSQAGMIAPYISSINNVDKLVLMNSTPKNLEDIIYTQNIESFEQTKISKQEKDKALLYIENEYVKAKNATNNNEELAFTLPVSYFHDMHLITDHKYLLNNELPTLICNGLSDFQVNKNNGSAAYQTLLSGKKNYIFKVYDELNHIMIKSDTLSLKDYNTKKELDENFIQDLINFINN